MATTERPKISVLITNHNYGRFVGDAIQSVLNQTLAPHEIVVVDDGSTDDSEAVLKSFGSNITAIFQQHSGFCRAVEAGVGVTTGDVIQLLDADDILAPSALEAVADAFMHQPDVVQVSIGRVVMDEQGRTRTSRPIRFSTGDVTGLLKTYGRYLCATTSGLSYRRSVLANLMPLSGLVDTADTYTAIGAAFAGPVAAVEKPLYRYRIHGQNMQVGKGDIDFLIRQREATAQCIEHHSGQVPVRDNEMIALRSANGEAPRLTTRLQALGSTAAEITRIEGLSTAAALQFVARFVMLVYPSKGRSMIQLGPGAWIRRAVRRDLPRQQQ